MPRPSRPLTPDRSARHLFGAEVRRHREQAGMTLERLAEVVRYSKSHIARIEIAEATIPPDLPGQLDAAFGTDGAFLRLHGLARHEVHPDRYKRRMELEARARSIQEYGGQLVPGLVQTEEYARAIFRSSRPNLGSEAIEEMVFARLGRQELLLTEPLPRLSIILDEAVLRRPIGGLRSWREQLNRLVELTDTPTSLVQVLPYEHGEHGFLGGTLTIWRLDDGSMVAYEESIDTGTLVEDSEKVEAHSRTYDLLRAYALSPSQSAALIESVVEALPA